MNGGCRSSSRSSGPGPSGTASSRGSRRSASAIASCCAASRCARRFAPTTSARAASRWRAASPKTGTATGCRTRSPRRWPAACPWFRRGFPGSRKSCATARRAASSHRTIPRRWPVRSPSCSSSRIAPGNSAPGPAPGSWDTSTRRPTATVVPGACGGPSGSSACCTSRRTAEFRCAGTRVPQFTSARWSKH